MTYAEECFYKKEQDNFKKSTNKKEIIEIWKETLKIRKSLGFEDNYIDRALYVLLSENNC